MSADASRPKVTHFNDCASVAYTLVSTARDEGLNWAYMPPEKVRPEGGFGSTPVQRLTQVQYQLRHLAMLVKSDVIHIHYATAAALLEHSFMPRRPYLLHLHGSDIRTQWLDHRYKAQIQRAIDGAHTVFYANLDTAENALSAREDAIYMPPLLRTDILPIWSPASERGEEPTVVFASRWDDSKGVEKQLQMAAALKSALPTGVNIVGLDWGPGAHQARALGVKLVPRMSRSKYLDLLAGADLVIGQPQGILATSELEAMAIGPVVACPGTQHEGPGGKPPVIQGTPEELVEQSMTVLKDPRSASEKMNARPWVVANNTPQQWIPKLQDFYISAALRGTRA